MPIVKAHTHTHTHTVHTHIHTYTNMYTHIHIYVHTWLYMTMVHREMCVEMVSISTVLAYPFTRNDSNLAAVMSYFILIMQTNFCYSFRARDEDRNRVSGYGTQLGGISR